MAGSRRSKFKLPLLSFRTTKSSGQPWSPANTGAVRLWLDAQLGSTITLATGVSQWDDRSGFGRHFTQGTAANQPAYSGSGSSAAVVFDGTNDALTLATPFITALGAMSAFMVVTPGTLATSKFFLAEDSSSSATPLNFIFATSSATATTGRNFLRNDASGTMHNFGETNQWASSTATIAGVTDDASANIIVYKDGTAYATRATSRSGVYSMTAVSLARRANGGTGSCTACSIHEVLVYSGVLSTLDRERTEGYLAHRWGLAGLLPVSHTYKAAPP